MFAPFSSGIEHWWNFYFFSGRSCLGWFWFLGPVHRPSNSTLPCTYWNWTLIQMVYGWFVPLRLEIIPFPSMCRWTSYSTLCCCRGGVAFENLYSLNGIFQPVTASPPEFTRGVGGFPFEEISPSFLHLLLNPWSYLALSRWSASTYSHFLGRLPLNPWWRWRREIHWVTDNSSLYSQVGLGFVFRFWLMEPSPSILVSCQI